MTQVILTNQITTHLSGALASQADLVSPADDLSLSEAGHFHCLVSTQPNMVPKCACPPCGLTRVSRSEFLQGARLAWHRGVSAFKPSDNVVQRGFQGPTHVHFWVQLCDRCTRQLLEPQCDHAADFPEPWFREKTDSHCQVPSGSLHVVCLHHPEGRPGSSRPTEAIGTL
ncbi:uncharacterized protein WM277_019898 isoform 1-T1 [Molossus nigricans]